MNPFTLVNELAVVAISALMMCVGTLWYSKYLFGSLWEKEMSHLPPLTQKQTLVVVSGTFLSYLFLQSGIAYLFAYAEHLGIEIFYFILGLWMFSCALILPLYLWERRSLLLYWVLCGFLGLFILIGVYVNAFWA